MLKTKPRNCQTSILLDPNFAAKSFPQSPREFLETLDANLPDSPSLQKEEQKRFLLAQKRWAPRIGCWCGSKVRDITVVSLNLGHPMFGSANFTMSQLPPEIWSIDQSAHTMTHLDLFFEPTKHNKSNTHRTGFDHDFSIIFSHSIFSGVRGSSHRGY